MRCLGIDLGEHTGIGVLDSPYRFVHCELLHLKPGRFDSYGTKFLLLDKRIRELIAEFKPDLVAFEIWRHHKGLQAAQVLGGYSATLTRVLADPGMPPGIGLEVGTIKKHATGLHSANKSLMQQSASLLWPKARIESDDVADALHMARLGIHQVSPTR